jgi:hypothetical protein
MLGDLYGEPAGGAGRTIDEDSFPRLQLGAFREAAQDDIPGLAMAAAVASSSPSGNARQCAEGTTVCSAMLPCGALGRTK